MSDPRLDDLDLGLGDGALAKLTVDVAVQDVDVRDYARTCSGGTGARRPAGGGRRAWARTAWPARWRTGT
jgi:hypothetical protein